MGKGDVEAKIVILGAQGVGKTSLVNRFVKNAFGDPSAAQSTIGASFLTKRVIDIDSSTTVRLQIWDTAGQERFRSIGKLYYRGAHAALLCYDITSAQSFEDMRHWMVEIKEQLPTDTVVHVVGMKADIVAQEPAKRQVPFERCIAYVAENLHPGSIQVSSHGGRGGGATAAAQQRPVTALPGVNSADYFGPQYIPESAPKKPTHSRSKSASTLLMAFASSKPTQIEAPKAEPATPYPQIVSPLSDRNSIGYWGQDLGWDCCHEVSASSGEGVEEVFRVITRRLVDQHSGRAALQARLAGDYGGGYTPYDERAAYFGGGEGASAHADPYGHGVNGNGSFRVGYGDKRRSWLGLGGFGPGVAIAEEGTQEDEVRGRKKGCC